MIIRVAEDRKGPATGSNGSMALRSLRPLFGDTRPIADGCTKLLLERAAALPILFRSCFQAEDMKRTLLVLPILAMLPVAGSCASFPCHGTLSRAERLVCNDKQLSALDYRLDGIYSLVLSLDGSGEALRSDQRTWLAVSRAKCSDIQCLSAAYSDRVGELMRLIQRVAEPLPAVLSAKVVHPVTKSAYCIASNADGGAESSLALSMKGSAVVGSIDGFFDCGRKVWGPIDIHGDKIGNVALLRFEAGWLDSSPMAAEALLVVSKGRHVYWRVLSEVEAESYVPISEQLRSER